MSYEKQNFTDGMVLTAAHMNHIEDGIEAAAQSSETELPAVTEEENGKVLQVVDGTWTAVTAEESVIKTCVEDYLNEALGGEY